MKTSLILLTRNSVEVTIRCLHSIRLYTDSPYEIIAVDNGSTDGTTAWLSVQPDVRLIANPDNRGFAAACNQGAASASGDHLLMLNNDTVVSPGWLSQMLAALHESRQVGIVGPMSNFVLKLQMVNASFGSEEEVHRFSRSFNRHDPARWREAASISGFCLLIRRDTWESLGGFDESFGVGGFEDVDLCYRALLAGLHLRVAGDTFVYHEGNRSFDVNAMDVRAISYANRTLFIRKWGFNPDRLVWYADPPFLPGRYASPHPRHAPATREIPCGWYAENRHGHVYRIERLHKRPVVSLSTLRRLKMTPDRIARVSSAFLRQLPDGVPVNADAFPHGYPDVYLAQDPAGGMYIVSHGIRYAIENEAAFHALGFRWEEAVSLSYPRLFSLYEGWPVRGNVWEEHELPDYRLYLGPDGGMYYSEGQRLRAVPDEAALHRYGLRARDAVAIPVEVFYRVPRGFGLP